MLFSRAFVEAVQAIDREFGHPLPKRLLEIGDAEKGWRVKLNMTNESIDNIDPQWMMLFWNGFPAGLFGMCSGGIAAGVAANEPSFIRWAKSYKATAATRQGA